MKPTTPLAAEKPHAHVGGKMGDCPCGEHAVKFCQGCDLSYCESCCAKRHRKGSFLRHTIVDLAAADHEPHVQRASSHESVVEPSICEECQRDPAVLSCRACELTFCEKCSASVHKIGAMQSHVDDGNFQYLCIKQSPLDAGFPVGSQANWDRSGDEMVSRQGNQSGCETTECGKDAFALKTAMIRDGEATETHVDSDQEISPGSPALQSDADAESYDLWSSWSVRSFSERSSSIDSTSQWRNLRSLSIDSKASSTNMGDDDLPLNSISKSLQSLAFASPQEDKQPSKDSSDMFALRPRSYSDYTSLHSQTIRSDPWQEPPKNAASEAMTYPSILELWEVMKTNFPSRHILIKSTTGSFDSGDTQRIKDALNNFGGIARTREEFAPEGLLFVTFFELKCAIGAAKQWFSRYSSADQSPSTFSPSRPFPGSRETISFCLPYELPDDVNCATLVVRLNGPPVSSTEMRQFCSRYGEVASVLQNDINSSKYIVEYNDARDIRGAIHGLTSSFHASGSITAARTSPPTLDMAKIQLFQERLDSVSVLAPVLDVGARPKSFSSSTASLLTSSPTSTSSSPLNPSILEPATGSIELSDATAIQSAGRASSPFDGGIYQMRNSAPVISDEKIWSGNATSSLRPRSSSSSLIGIGASSSLFAAPSTFGDPAPYSNPYSPGLSTAGSGTFPSYMSSHHSQQQEQHGIHESSQMQQHHAGSQLHQQHLQQRIMQASGMAPKYSTPPRSGSDPNIRTSTTFGSPASSQTNANSNSTSGANGRNDQGVGEFSLSIERVSSGDDKRTTLMIRNIPNKYTQQMLLAEINQNHRGNYDFFYLPIDFKNKCNMGYAFINFMEAESIIPFYKEFDSQKWTNFNSEKVCAISYARLQGKQAMITRFQNSSLLEKHESYRPLVFVSSGVNRGRPETFPAPKQPQHKKQLMHPHHHHMMMGGADDFGGGHASSRVYMPNHHHHHHQQQQQQQLQALHHAHQLMASHHHHAGLHGMPLPPQGANLPMNFHHGLQASLHQQQHVPALYQHQEHHLSAANSMPLPFGDHTTTTSHAAGFTP